MNNSFKKENLLILKKKVSILKNFYLILENANKVDDYLLLREYLYDTLSWVEICEKEITISAKNDKELIQALKFANNQKKHEALVVDFSQSTEALFPSDSLLPSDKLYPKSFSIYWNTLTFPSSLSPSLKGITKSQFLLYNKSLKGNNILLCFDRVIKIFEKYN